jgi:4-aminobutyrate aminotransferase-like enzyme
MVKLVNFGLTWKFVQKKNILNYVQDMSSFMKIELIRVGKEKGHISNVRGYGTYLGFDLASEQNAELMQKWLFRTGIHMLRCGPTTFGMRPALILGAKECAIVRDNLWHYSPRF